MAGSVINRQSGSSLPWLLLAVAVAGAGVVLWQQQRQRDDWSEREAALSEQLDLAHEETSALQQRLDAYSDLQTQLDQMRDELDARRGDTVALRDRLRELTDLPDQLSRTTAELAKARQLLSDTEATRDNALNSNKAMRSELDSANYASLDARMARREAEERAAIAEAAHQSLAQSTASLLRDRTHLVDKADRLARALDSTMSERDSARQQADELQQRLSKLSSEVEDTRRAQAESVEKLSTTQARLQATSMQAGELDAQLRELATQREVDNARFDALRNKLEGQLGQQGVTIETLRNRLTVITLQNDVLFPSGSAELNKRAQHALDEIAGALGEYPERRILVEGHSDSVPLRKGRIYPTNWELSAARAAAAVRFLADHDGIAPKRLTVTGYGKYHPVASNKSAEGRKRNRRIEIRLLPDDSWLNGGPATTESADNGGASAQDG